MNPRLLVLLLLLVGISIAQDVPQDKDTNFPAGPQYLIPNANPMLLRPIATPSLNLSGATLAGTSEVPVVTQPPAYAPPETIVYLSDVYWGEHPPSQIFDRRMETPGMTPDQTQWYMNAVQSGLPLPVAPLPETVEVAALENPEVPTANVIELSGGPMPANLPPSIFDPGVTAMTDSQSLLQHGYGISVGETAAYWKTHKRQIPRVFTNQDMRHE